MKKILLFSAACITAINLALSQGTAINSSGAAAHNSAILDISSTSKGIRIPRVGLSDTSSSLSPVSNPANGLLVFDTLTGAPGSGISPGFYYWDAAKTQWLQLTTNIGSASAWLLNGNAGTDSVTDFIGTSDAQALVFKTNNSERFRINKNGLVGIGTASPLFPLHIVNNSASAELFLQSANSTTLTNTAAISFRESASDQWIIAKRNNSGWGARGSDIDISYFNGSAWNDYFTIKPSNGFIGIGTTGPNNKLDVNGYIQSFGNDGVLRVKANAGKLYQLVSRADGNFTIDDVTAGFSRFWINGSNGNVGVGTMNPATALHVTPSTGFTVGEDKTAGSANTAGTVKLISSGDNAYSTTISTATQTQNINYTLPANDGNANEYLKTDGAGSLSWAAASGGSASVGFPGTQVFSGAAPTSWTDLNLSSVVGTNSAFVYIKIYQSAGSTGYEVRFRTNGETKEIYSVWGSSSAAQMGNDQIAYIDAVTDSNGIIEWKANTTLTLTLYVMVYIK